MAASASNSDWLSAPPDAEVGGGGGGGGAPPVAKLAALDEEVLDEELPEVCCNNASALLLEYPDSEVREVTLIIRSFLDDNVPRRWPQMMNETFFSA
ncbi:hypothetical protein AP071_09475 [Rhodobacter capsulatus]|nr:hypothetical protein AP073_08270 [Rhodobacter capsulatus]KQB11725.1 hypothetical protein AP071_09475 [Rhodobacter capsulatus]